LTVPEGRSTNNSKANYFDPSIVSVGDGFEDLPFFGDVQKCCVSFVDMVHSTEIIAQISNPSRIRKYYSVFINTIAAIAKSFEAKIIKNTGDCLIYYFPKTSDCSDPSAFQEVIECGLAMAQASSSINMPTNDYKLPAINYRISADYGAVQATRSLTSAAADLFGHAISLCSMMNSLASNNEMVIGNSLFQIIKEYYSENYNFQRLNGTNIVHGGELYTIYSVKGKNASVAKPGRDPALSNPNARLRVQSFKKQKILPANKESSKDLAHNILIVDDEPDALFTYKTFLATEGFNVDAFTVPEEALNTFRTRHPSYYSLVIVDIRMPGLNGLQLYHHLKRINMSGRFLFVSALDAAGELISILPNSTDIRVLKKPVDQENFMTAIRELLGYNM
jgi:CheY-like chemotaxis protein/class 3 adenylate cyclase